MLHGNNEAMNPMLAMMLYWSVAFKSAKDPFGWNLHKPSTPATQGSGQDAGGIPTENTE